MHGFVTNNVLRPDLVHLGWMGQVSRLDSLFVVDVFGTLVLQGEEYITLGFDLLFLLHDLFGPFPNLLQQFPVHLILQGNIASDLPVADPVILSNFMLKIHTGDKSDFGRIPVIVTLPAPVQYSA